MALSPWLEPEEAYAQIGAQEGHGVEIGGRRPVALDGDGGGLGPCGEVLHIVGAAVGGAAGLDTGLPQDVAGHLDIGARGGALCHGEGDALGHAGSYEKQ